MELSGCRLRRVLLRRQRSDASHWRSAENVDCSDAVNDSNYSDSVDSEDDDDGTANSRNNRKMFILSFTGAGLS